MKFNCIKRLLILLSLVTSSLAKGQFTCSLCSMNTALNDTLVIKVNVTDTTTYTISTGETLCIYKTGTCRGSIVLNGGTICNNGKLIPKSFVFNSGVIINNKMMKVNSNFYLSSSTSCINSPGSVFNINGSLSITGGSLVNEGIINTSGNINNNSGVLDNKTIINCSSLLGSNSIIDHGRGQVNTKN